MFIGQGHFDSGGPKDYYRFGLCVAGTGIRANGYLFVVLANEDFHGDSL